MAEWTHYSLPDAEMTEVLAKGEGQRTVPPNTDMRTLRELGNALARKMVETADKESLKGIRVDEKQISVFKPEGEISIRIYTPLSQGPEEKFPVLVDFHGGGYCLGNLDSDELKCRLACQKHRIVIVNVDYRLAPEFPWPIGIDDSYTAVKWVVNNTEELRVDLKKGFIVNGLSAGAMFVCIITQRACTDSDLKGKLTGQILQVPPAIHPGPDGYSERFRDKIISPEQNKDDPILTKELITSFWDNYKAGPATHLEVSPLLAESLVGVPPAYIQVAGGDPLRDEGLCYAQRLEEDGVPVKLDIYPGVPHGFSIVFPQLKKSQKWRDDFDQGVQWLLRNSTPQTPGIYVWVTRIMALPTKTPAWFFQNRVSGAVDFSLSPSGTFRLGEVSLPSESELPSSALLIQNLYLANEPGQLIRISTDKSGLAEKVAKRAGKKMPEFPIGAPMWVFSVSRVLKVGGTTSSGGDGKFKEGDLVFSMSGWVLYAVVQKSQANLLQTLPGLSPSVFLGTLGMSGQSAYWCLVDVLKPKPTDTLVVSGAAGAVGNVAVQYAKKVLGVSRVVGIAGSQEKCEWLLEIGADAALNYKSKTFAQDLENVVPNGVDKFFDNVGGPILDEVLVHMNPHGVVGLCGAMAVLDKGLSTSLHNFGLILLNSLELKGFSMLEYFSRIEEGGKALTDAVMADRFVAGTAETVVDLRGKFEDIPKTWHGIFEGKSTGKMITRISD